MPYRRLILLALLLLGGCQPGGKPSKPRQPAEPAGPVRLLVVEDPPLAAAIEQEWEARTGTEIEIRRVTQEELLTLAPWQADAVIYPPGLMGELAERRRIIPLPDEAIDEQAYERRKLLPLVRRNEMRWGNDVYAVSLAAPRLALLYRADLFEHLGIGPPATWDEYLHAASRLADRSQLGELAPADDQRWSGIVEPWAEHWRSEMLLARMASAIRRPGQLSALLDFSTLESQMASPPAVAALENMRAAAEYQAVERFSIGPHEARWRIMAGECGMALTWLPEGAMPKSSVSAAARMPETPFRLGVAPLPGTAEVYRHDDQQWETREKGPLSVPLVGFAGRVGSVTAEAVNRRGAVDLLMLLSGPEWSVDVARRSVQAHPFRRSHLQSLRPWLPEGTSLDTTAAYAAYLEELELSEMVLVSPRIPGRPRYLAALDTAVQSVATGEATAREAAATAAEAWNAITKDIGVEKQRAAYRQSLGIAY